MGSLMRVIQFAHPALGRCLGVVEDDVVENLTERVPTINNLVAAFNAARLSRQPFERSIEAILAISESSPPLSYSQLLTEGRVLSPIDGSANRVLVSGTGLTHLGSVEQRDAMHKAAQTEGPKSDSRKMFELGLEGGRPPRGRRGAAPEWFYKGDANILRGPGQTLDIPAFAPDGGEEPEIAGVYINDEHGTPFRLGFVQGNEWSDHATENINYLYLAPSKLRTCAIGPELITGLKFDDIRGRCRVMRGEQTLYDSGELLTGEANMCHSLANLEDHHFKFPQHRQPGDIHVHFFGTCKLSFQHRTWKYEDGDLVEVSFIGMGEPLRNTVRRIEPCQEPIRVEVA
jgi:hypothetical protein